jgi:hypothetical protein
MIVYHQEGYWTHAMRFANATDAANPENPYGSFVTPPVISWCNFTGDGISNEEMRSLLTSFDYGSANCPLLSVAELSFWDRLNIARPESYPVFPATEDCDEPKIRATMPWIPLLLLDD